MKSPEFEHGYRTETLPLFDGGPCTPKPPPETEQDRQLRRVKSKLASTIELFFEGINIGETFHSDDLHNFVNERVQCSPASDTRVMRDMRAAGQINYEVANRRQSLYRKLATGASHGCGST